MRRLPLLFTVALAAGCVSEDSLLEGSSSRRPLKVVVLEVEGPRGSLVVTEPAMADIRRLPGVIDAVRGSGLREVRCLVEERTDPQILVSGLSPRYRAVVLRVVRREEPGAD